MTTVPGSASPASDASIIPHQWRHMADELALARQQIAALERRDPIRLVAIRLAEIRATADLLTASLDQLAAHGSGWQVHDVYRTLDGAAGMLESVRDRVAAILGRRDLGGDR